MSESKIIAKTLNSSGDADFVKKNTIAALKNLIQRIEKSSDSAICKITAVVAEDSVVEVMTTAFSIHPTGVGFNLLSTMKCSRTDKVGWSVYRKFSDTIDVEHLAKLISIDFNAEVKNTAELDKKE